MHDRMQCFLAACSPDSPKSVCYRATVWREVPTHDRLQCLHTTDEIDSQVVAPNADSRRGSLIELSLVIQRSQRRCSCRQDPLACLIRILSWSRIVRHANDARAPQSRILELLRSSRVDTNLIEPVLFPATY